MQVNEASVTAVLRDRASLQPNDTALTFIDYERDGAGVAETLTWSQLYQRTRAVARELSHCGSTGDRAVILAPQGLDYVVAFLGALHAGRIAVPLSVPLGGVTNERVGSVLRDTAPAVILTTSAVVGNVAVYAGPQPGGSAPSVVEVDLLGTDSRHGSDTEPADGPSIAYLQYTSGSTRQPAGVMVSHTNVLANFEQAMSDYFPEYGNMAPPDTTIVSWLPFYHDMGLILGIFTPILGGFGTALMSPVSFLQSPARWMQLLASSYRALSAAPNFALDLTVRRTSDDDMAGLDLGDVLAIIVGSERVHPATLRRFTQRFARCKLRPPVIRPSYGLAEATVYAASRGSRQPPKIVHFDSEQLSDGRAVPLAGGTPLVSYGVPQSPLVRIVDRDSRTECPAGMIGEIWVHGENVALGYWQNPHETERTFAGTLVAPSVGTPEGPWLRTGDVGFVSDGELFVVGRIKDLLIIYGRNHSPDDIEATIQEITRGRVAAISVPDKPTEKLVVIIELRNRGDSDLDVTPKFGAIKSDVTSAISNSHGIAVADLVVVAPGSIPITTSGKVRRAACVEQYRLRQFARLDA